MKVILPLGNFGQIVVSALLLQWLGASQWFCDACYAPARAGSALTGAPCAQH
jgi:hypothetical protein